MIFILCLPGTNIGFSQTEELNSLRLMFYNVENLFDIFDDTLKNDNDFLPSGVLRWNQTRYRNKINSLYKTIIMAGEWAPPEIVAMSEVENRKVLEDLIYGTYLSKYKYRIVHEDSPDQRGIDVCLIYRSDLLSLISAEYWMPEGVKEENFTTRKVLYSKFALQKDTLHLIANHWPSRRGGVLAGESMRLNIAKMVREKTDSIILSSHFVSKVIIMGDFNSTPDDQEIQVLTTDPLSSGRLINISEKHAGEGNGTYRYQGTWEMIDQVLISESLLRSTAGFYAESDCFSILKSDVLLMKDPKYPGFTPYSTYRGYRYQGGFSDHLPVLLKLSLLKTIHQE
ncbi:MAG: endonuclease/exonuclease/phosphatase family protein [Bacteroidales bacterium]|nr:endonuclease/exonuclease/phosphatase family protein [Bacteroidales bacterium]